MKTIRSNKLSASANKWGYRGVEFRRDRGTFRARLEPNNGKRGKWLGTFKNPVDAALAYDKEARRVYGEDAALNFPDGDEIAVRQSMKSIGMCINGHDLSQTGYQYTDTQINCRICNNDASKRCYKRNRLQSQSL